MTEEQQWLHSSAALWTLISKISKSCARFRRVLSADRMSAGLLTLPLPSDLKGLLASLSDSFSAAAHASLAPFSFFLLSIKNVHTHTNPNQLTHRTSWSPLKLHAKHQSCNDNKIQTDLGVDDKIRVTLPTDEGDLGGSMPGCPNPVLTGVSSWAWLEGQLPVLMGGNADLLSLCLVSLTTAKIFSILLGGCFNCVWTWSVPSVTDWCDADGPSQGHHSSWGCSFTSAGKLWILKLC